MPHRGLIISPVGTSYAALLSALHGRCFDEHWREADFLALLDGGSLALLAVEAEQPLGFLLCRAAAGEAEILTIGTVPEARGRGIARRLLAEAVSRLSADRVEALFLEVAVSNSPARRLYAASGFQEAGRRKNYYPGPEDALVLRRDLIA
jgi:ribosomal-protein-alanine N-acetyltransferase